MAASPQPASQAQSGDETSPFHLLKGRSGDVQGFIMRTRSLDEGSPHGAENFHSRDHADQEDSLLGTAALHSSFDAAMLQDRSFSPHFSEDEDEYGDISGKKHMLPQAPLETSEANPPGTVRKQPRTRAVTISKTPARPRLRPPGAMKKAASTTPSSAAKRRRAHWQPREPPVSRMPPTTPFQAHVSSPPTTTSKLDGSIFGKGLIGSAFAASPPVLTPNRNTGPFGTAKSMSKWHNTGTTAASTLLESTLESSDSVDTSSPTTTRFRFTAFPASLPRVNNPRSRECPDSVRKCMYFAEPVSSEANQSRDDDGTQNTSISSLSADGNHQHLAPAPGALPPTILDLHPPLLGDYDNDSMKPIHAKLFAEDEEFGYSDDDETASSSVRDIVGRTRLNFNTVLSPDKDGSNHKGTGRSFTRSYVHFLVSDFKLTDSSPMLLETNLDLTHAYDQRRINSFPSSLSSHTNMNNLSGCEVVGGSSLTPTRPSDKDFRTLTPRDVQLHFPLEEECSPIPGFKDDHACVELLGPLPSSSDHSTSPVNPKLTRRTTKPTSAESSTKGGDSNMKEDFSTGSESANEKSRRLRPMPDMSAFESNAMSSRGDRSNDDSATSDSKGMASSQRLTCPPTPVRTPAWANEGGAHGVLGRQSSLITTKVLLSVPSQVVQGRCSLENSVLDDDSKASNNRFNNNAQTRGADSRFGAKESETASDKVAAPKLTTFGPRAPESAVKVPRLQAPPRLMRRVPVGQEVESVISFSNDFEILSVLGSGAFADVYKVRSVEDNRLYAVKRNRRQFRGKRDRDMALSEVQAMQKLQSVCADPVANSTQSAEKNSYCLYLLFFYRAWQEDGYFLCQTELCCRDTCRELLDSVKFLWNTARNKYPSLERHLPTPSNTEPGSMEDAVGRLVPNDTVWKICHDIAAGLSHIHSHGLVHHDIKPSNIFFVAHPRFGAMCKIGDFGMAGEIDSSADGLEGDTRYMPPELLASGARHPSADIFSLGLTIYEIATDAQGGLPREGPHWHSLRSAGGPTLPKERGDDLLKLVQSMTDPTESKRPTADTILKSDKLVAAGRGCEEFLRDYIHDIEKFDRMEEERLAVDCHEDQTPRNGSHRATMPVRSPSLSMLLSNPPNLLSPVGKCIH